ncbi:MAG: sucrase ferredoxin [Actinobacteria bacterium]|nr:sucrase ferredoxin [Actinomycetota bacterium]
MAPLERCAPASERRDDQLHGTAAPARRFVLVERPGAWGRNAVGEACGRSPALAALYDRCLEAAARLLLIRRVHREPGEHRRFAIADARPGCERTWWGSFDTDDELDHVDPLHPSGSASDEPTFLVCTHGRRDACCAQRGWPVAAALTDALPGQVWQCSHVGGDRFAANVVALPHGLYYGRVTPANSVELASTHIAGRVRLELLRGRSCFTSAVQAAQHYARLELGLDAIDALHALGLEREPDESVAVRLAYDAGEMRVVVRAHRSEPIPRLTCAALESTSVRTWELRGIT